MWKLPATFLTGSVPWTLQPSFSNTPASPSLFTQGYEQVSTHCMPTWQTTWEGFSPEVWSLTFLACMLVYRLKMQAYAQVSYSLPNPLSVHWTSYSRIFSLMFLKVYSLVYQNNVSLLNKHFRWDRFISVCKQRERHHPVPGCQFVSLVDWEKMVATFFV